YELLQLAFWKKREEAEIGKLLDKGVENLTEREKKRLDHLIEANAETKKEAEKKRILFAEVNGVTSAESQRLNVLKEQTGQIDEQIKKSKVLATIKARTGKEYEDQSTENLVYV